VRNRSKSSRDETGRRTAETLVPDAHDLALPSGASLRRKLRTVGKACRAGSPDCGNAWRYEGIFQPANKPRCHVNPVGFAVHADGRRGQSVAPNAGRSPDAPGRRPAAESFPAEALDARHGDAASSGVQGPGEIIKWDGRRALISSSVILSLRWTSSSSDGSISPSRCTRFT